MATYTTNYNLKKPEAEDFYNVEDQNGNMDAIDQALNGIATSVSGKADAAETTSALAGKANSTHNQAASTITAGTFAATGVVAATGTDYTTNRIRNGVFTTTDPGANASTSYANGSIIYVYE